MNLDAISSKKNNIDFVPKFQIIVIKVVESYNKNIKLNKKDSHPNSSEEH